MQLRPDQPCPQHPYTWDRSDHQRTSEHLLRPNIVSIYKYTRCMCSRRIEALIFRNQILEEIGKSACILRSITRQWLCLFYLLCGFRSFPRGFRCTHRNNKDSLFYDSSSLLIILRMECKRFSLFSELFNPSFPACIRRHSVFLPPLPPR